MSYVDMITKHHGDLEDLNLPEADEGFSTGGHGSHWLSDEVEEVQDYINNINSEENKEKRRENHHKRFVDRARDLIRQKDSRRNLRASNSTQSSVEHEIQAKKRERREDLRRNHTQSRIER